MTDIGATVERAVVRCRAGALVLFAAGSIACSHRGAPGSSDETCGVDRGVMAVATVLDDPHDPCHDWVDAVHGRSVRVDQYDHGSGSLWSRHTDAGVAVLTTAAHVMSPCWPMVSAQEDAGLQPMCSQALWDPKAVVGEAALRLADPAGGPPGSQWSAAFALFNPDFPIADLDPPGLLPRNDFAVYAVDSQLLAAYSSVPPGTPDPIVDAPPAFHDPLGLAETVPSWADPVPGGTVIAVGFPANGSNLYARLEHASVGTVLDDDAARGEIAHLAELGDTEGMIAYDPETEFLFEGNAQPGMSGSGVFDEDGAQLGIVVRASFSDPQRQIVRAVRMRYVAGLIAAARDALPAAMRTEVARYLPPLEEPRT